MTIFSFCFCNTYKVKNLDPNLSITNCPYDTDQVCTQYSVLIGYHLFLVWLFQHPRHWRTDQWTKSQTSISIFIWLVHCWLYTTGSLGFYVLSVWLWVVAWKKEGGGDNGITARKSTHNTSSAKIAVYLCRLWQMSRHKTQMSCTLKWKWPTVNIWTLSSSLPCDPALLSQCQHNPFKLLLCCLPCTHLEIHVVCTCVCWSVTM